MHAFNCARSAVHSDLANGLNPPISRDRHLAVDAESDADILTWIQRQAEKNAAETRIDRKNYCREVWKFEVLRGWVNSFISRYSAEFSEKKSFPQKEPRLQVPRILPEEPIRTMHGTLQGCPADLVFNLDEVGISDWEDRKPKHVKHISIVTCISAVGACLTPYVVRSQDSATLHRAFEATRMQIGKHFILKHRAKPYVNVDLFENDIQTVFLPDLAITGVVQNIREEDTIRLMDICSPQLTSLLS
jgi:hypothetical protein